MHKEITSVCTKNCIERMQGKCAAGQNATDNKSKIEKKFQSFLGSVRLVMSVINNVRQLL